MALGRTFSFEDNDERQLSSNEQERGAAFQGQQNLGFQPYHDSPQRDMISLPPQYTSSPPRERSLSPVSRSSTPSPSPASRRYHPSQHPDSTFQQRTSAIPRKALPRRQPSSDSLDAPPPPPPHRRQPSEGAGFNRDYRDPILGYPQPLQSRSMVTTGMDNFGRQAEGGGPDDVATGAADRNQRESGLHALQGLQPARSRQSYIQDRYDRSSSPDTGFTRAPLKQRDSYASNVPLAAGAATPGSMTPGTTPDLRSSGYSGRSIHLDDYPSPHPVAGGYNDSPYYTNSHIHNAQISGANIDPYNIADDGDDGFIPDPRRRSVMNLGRQTSNEQHGGEGVSRAAKRGAIAGALGGLMGRKRKAPVSSGSYDPVRQGAGAGSEQPQPRTHGEKSEWLSRQTKGNNKMRWVVGFAIGAVVFLAIIGGIVGGVLGTHTAQSSSGDNSNTAAGDTAANGDLGKNSPEIQALMNNPGLHKVFPGMDYTPWGTQYPLCMTYPPSQNNVTRDMAVLSQLTNAVRLYGTDCNQTEMVLHAIDRLELTDMKVWLGVWIDTNDTTNERQLAQMYTIIDETKDLSIYKGAIIGNEALYRAGLDKASSEASLIQILTDVKSNFTSKGYNIPVATSDLGDNWNGQLVDAVDMVMSNIHPFFAGVTAEVAAAWTWTFWQQNDAVLTQGTTKPQIISETGWPSAGGTDCGGTTGDCAPGQSGSIAGVDEMNTYMSDWVCQALENGTEYFWFEAFDEPWKVIYDTPGKDWEDKWGLMDPARNIKPGLQIPECGGKTVS